MKAIRILVAEDNRADVVLIQEALKINKIPHVLDVMQDGAQAVSAFASMGRSGGAPCPDIVLLDLNLPKVEGWEVLRELRKHPGCATTPVIVISSSDAPKDREKLEPLNVAHYFKKPYDFEEYMKLGELILGFVKSSELSTPSAENS